MLRKGMWVLYQGKVGILAARFHDEGEVHLVDKEGMTIAVLPLVPLSSCAQASYDDIPEARRPQPGLARALGYLHT